MFYHNIDPVFLNLFGLEIRYYGLIWLLGFVIAYLFVRHLSKKRDMKIDADDLFLWILIGVVLGGRLGYILFYNMGFYLANPLEVFAVWHGGMSFHGGLIGGIIAVVWFSKKKGLDALEIGDILMIPLAFGLFLGRIGNFINGELVGRVTDVSWCFNFQGYEGCRHPSQLYESAKNLFIFGALWFLKDKNLKKGTLFWCFIFMYGAIRSFIEFFRAPDPQVGFIFGLTMGQILSSLMIIIGGFFLFRNFSK